MHMPARPDSRAIAAAPPVTTDLVQLVDFKWLMSGAGYRVDLQRLQADPDYAHDRLLLAAASHCPTLREVGRRIARSLAQAHGGGGRALA